MSWSIHGWTWNSCIYTFSNCTSFFLQYVGRNMKTWERKGFNHRFYEKMILLALLLSSLQKNAIQILQHWSSCSFTVFPLILLLSSMHVYIVLSNSLCMQCSVSLRVAQQRIVDSHFSYNSCSFCRLKNKQRTGFFLNFSISMHIFSKQKK